MACCDVCAYSLNVSHLVVTQASRLAVRCLGAPTHEASYCLPSPHVVTSENPVKFPALYRLIPLYHEPMTTCSLPSRLSFCTLPLLSFPRCDGSTPSHGVPVTHVQRVRFICCTSSHDQYPERVFPIDAHDYRCLSTWMAVHS
jgi:hypothetical protein